MIRPGSTKPIEAIVPAADAIVWTMLFSRMFASLEGPQQRHRYDGGGDRSGEGQPDLEPEIEVRGGEQEGQQDAERDRRER